MPASHLYVHVPFCARRCSYCDFSIAVRSPTPVNEYVGALGRELATLRRDSLSPELTTVYLGGGTPSRLGGDGIVRVLAEVRQVATIAGSAEITIEANPDDVSREVAEEWAAAGVNRVSLGGQSFDDQVLRWMHRTHAAHSITRAVRDLRAAGISNISLDLIFALPSHLRRDWALDLELALDLEPTHISLYGLTVEPHTPLWRWRDRGSTVEASEDTYAEEFVHAHEVATRAGFDHYEVSNFARPGRASRHNSAYWSGAPYVGVGPSAHSYDGTARRWNVASYADWVRRLAENRDPSDGEETLTAENRVAEEVYLGLRTSLGLAISPADGTAANPWVAAGWAEVNGSRLILTASGWLRLDALAADLTARRTRSSGAVPGVHALPELALST